MRSPSRACTLVNEHNPFLPCAHFFSPFSPKVCDETDYQSPPLYKAAGTSGPVQRKCEARMLCLRLLRYLRIEILQNA